MTVGNKTYKNLAVPLHGESEIRQVTAATDMLTLTRITGGTGDYLVTRDDGGSEGISITAKNRIKWPVTPTTAPTTGLTKGEMFVIFGANSQPSLGICVSTAANTIKYVPAFKTKTIGRGSAT